MVKQRLSSAACHPQRRTAHGRIGWQPVNRSKPSDLRRYIGNRALSAWQQAGSVRIPGLRAVPGGSPIGIGGPMTDPTAQPAMAGLSRQHSPGEIAGTIQRQEQEPAEEGAEPYRALSIAREGGEAATFISTDTISLRAVVIGMPSDHVNWTVAGIGSQSGGGQPPAAANQNPFRFTPNPTNRPTSGSRVPNDPIMYRVTAGAGGLTANYSLVQDEIDIIRQEYVDFGAGPPARGVVVAPAVAGFNRGNYLRIVDNGMPGALNAVEAEFAQLTQQAAAGSGPAATPAPGAAPAAPVPVPAITVFSGYRNPRRNVAAGSNFPVTSRHVWGSALDLGVAGANAVLWARLRQAGVNAGYTSICEDGPTPKPCNDPGVDHVHIQW